MPIYEFYNKETDKYFEEIMTYNEKCKLLESNPNIMSTLNKVGIVTMVGSIDSKTDNTWKEVLNKVAESHPNSNVGKRYGKKTHNQIKTQTVLEKYRKKLEKRLND